MIAIALDHIPASVLSHAMLHNFAYCDSAEVFVFMSGYVAAASWLAIATRKSVQTANLRFWRRGREIYAAYLCTAALMLLTSAAAVTLRVDSPLVGESGYLRFAMHLFRMLADIALFRDQPYLAGVLPMYVALVMALPLVMPLARRSPDLAVCGSATKAKLAVTSQNLSWFRKSSDVYWDTTDHGGEVITGSKTMMILDVGVARKGDLIRCPKHPEINPNVIEEGDGRIHDNGIPVARDGHCGTCGCHLISSLKKEATP